MTNHAPVKARCTNCKKEYISTNCLEELGKCWVCNHNENQEFLEMSKVNQNYHIRIKKRKPARALMPLYLGDELLTKVQKFFSENYYGKRNFRFKYSATDDINEKFGIKLSTDEVLALAAKGALQSKGLKCSFD